MFKKINKKGFTLAELLIVVAIIGVLVAISIPIFTAQLRKAKLATNQANARAAYAAVTAVMLTEGQNAGKATYSVATAKLTDLTGSNKLNAFASQSQKSAVQNWSVSTTVGTKKVGDETAKTWIVAIDSDGKVSYSATY